MRQSPLLQLPPELRTLIYAHVFDSAYAVEPDKVDIQHPLVRTCRQVRAESLLMYYTMVRISFHMRDGPVSPLLRWMRAIGRDNCLLVREIRIWDMHDNVLTMVSPVEAERHLARAPQEDVVRVLSEECSTLTHNAMSLLQKTELRKGLLDIGLGLRQFQDRPNGLSIMLGTSRYALHEVG